MGSGGDAAAQKLSLLQHDQRRGLLFVGGRGLTVRSADFATDRQLEGTTLSSNKGLARNGDFFDVSLGQAIVTIGVMATFRRSPMMHAGIPQHASPVAHDLPAVAESALDSRWLTPV